MKKASRSKMKRFTDSLLNIEIKVLLTFLVIILAFWIFFFISNAVTAGKTQQLDVQVVKFFRDADNNPIGPGWLPDMMRDITALGGGTVIALITIIVLIYLLLIKKYHELVLVLVAVAGGALLGLGLKEFFGRERPDVFFRLIDEATLSFPSGHSMMSTVIYLSIAALLTRIQAQRTVRIYMISVALFLAAIIGFSRVYLVFTIQQML